MESGAKKWGFQGKQGLEAASNTTVRGYLNLLMDSINQDNCLTVIPLGHGDPSHFPIFRTTPAAEDAIVDALRSGKHNCYATTVGILPARRLDCKLSLLIMFQKKQQNNFKRCDKSFLMNE